MSDPCATFRTVLVPVELIELEGDEPGAGPKVHIGDVDLGVNEATRRAMELAGRLVRDGTVVLFHAIRDLAGSAAFMRAKDSIALEDAARRNAATALDAIGAALLPDAERRIEVTVSDDPLDAILHAVADDGIEAIVLATSSRTRVQRAFLGSTADKVIRRAPCPVVVVPAHPA